jgi:hypothetical protein
MSQNSYLPPLPPPSKRVNLRSTSSQILIADAHH